MQLPKGPDTTPTYLYNPTRDDFKCFRADEENIQHEYVLPSRQLLKFPKYLADHIGKKLAQKMALEHTNQGLTYEIRYKESLQKVFPVV